MSDMSSQEPTGTEPEGYEKRDISVAKTLVVGMFVIILIVGFLVVLNEYFIAVTEEVKQEQVLTPQSVTIREQLARDAELLNSYAVVDSAKGVYRIPIERAMKLQADEAFQKEAH